MEYLQLQRGSADEGANVQWPMTNGDDTLQCKDFSLYCITAMVLAYGSAY
jgi:hypothetical protein